MPVRKKSCILLSTWTKIDDICDIFHKYTFQVSKAFKINIMCIYTFKYLAGVLGFNCSFPVKHSNLKWKAQVRHQAGWWPCKSFTMVEMLLTRDKLKIYMLPYARVHTHTHPQKSAPGDLGIEVRLLWLGCAGNRTQVLLKSSKCS